MAEQNIQIRSWITGGVLFSTTATDLRAAVEKAVSDKANLRGADLRGANLSGTNLVEANLSGADLRGANLSGAHLVEANLSEANLRGADLSGAHLRWADLSGTDLSGADLSGADPIGTVRRVLSVGPAGSESGTLYVTFGDPIRVTRGCFNGTLDEFAAAVEKKHAGGPHGDEYRALITMIRALAPLRAWEAANRA